MDWNKFAHEVHQTAVENGLWDKPRSFDEVICECLVHLGRAYEEYRDGRPNYYHLCVASGEKRLECDLDNGGCSLFPGITGCDNRDPKPDGAAAELGECVLRVLDYEIVAVSKALILDGFTAADKSFSKTILLCVEYLCKSEATRSLGFRCASLSQVAEIILAWAKQEGIDLESILRELHECEKARAGRREGVT